jgi:hypothetical protein
MAPMSAPFVVWIIVGLVTIVALLAVLVGLVRHVMVLSRSLGRFQREIAPIAQEIAEESGRASTRAARVGGERSFGRS